MSPHFPHAHQSPYNLDICPCDFFLFGHLKMKLTKRGLDMIGNMQGGVEKCLGEVIPRSM
jgi:hypothetical protein